VVVGSADRHEVYAVPRPAAESRRIRNETLQSCIDRETGTPMGKFFIGIVIVSVAILLAIYLHVLAL
jgi:hypothetical protein